MILNLINEFDQSGDILFSIASSDSYEWYVRRGAIESLDKRADIKHLEKLIAYLPSMKTSEVYNATIEAFAHHHIKEALGMIKKTSKKSRSFSDDEGVLFDLMAQQHNPWRKERHWLNFTKIIRVKR